jgi:outer membrane PBP1 activator LpoA protein
MTMSFARAHSCIPLTFSKRIMKKTILILIVAFAASLSASTENKTKEVDAIVEAYRSGKTAEATEMLKKLDPESYRPVQDLIKRVIEQEKKVEAARRQLEVQKQFLNALSTRLSTEVEKMFEAHPPSGG